MLTATGVVVNNAGLVKKVSFPREILALAAIGSAGVFFFFQSCVMVIFMLVLHQPGLGPAVAAARWPSSPWSCCRGAGRLPASVNVYLRDTQHLVEVLVGAAWFWACPSSTRTSPRWHQAGAHGIGLAVLPEPHDAARA